MDKLHLPKGGNPAVGLWCYLPGDTMENFVARWHHIHFLAILHTSPRISFGCHRQLAAKLNGISFYFYRFLCRQTVLMDITPTNCAYSMRNAIYPSKSTLCCFNFRTILRPANDSWVEWHQRCNNSPGCSIHSWFTYAKPVWNWTDCFIHRVIKSCIWRLRGFLPLWQLGGRGMSVNDSWWSSISNVSRRSRKCHLKSESRHYIFRVHLYATNSASSTCWSHRSVHVNFLRVIIIATCRTALSTISVATLRSITVLGCGTSKCAGLRGYTLYWNTLEHVRVGISTPPYPALFCPIPEWSESPKQIEPRLLQIDRSCRYRTGSMPCCRISRWAFWTWQNLGEDFRDFSGWAWLDFILCFPSFLSTRSLTRHKLTCFPSSWSQGVATVAVDLTGYISLKYLAVTNTSWRYLVYSPNGLKQFHY